MLAEVLASRVRTVAIVCIALGVISGSVLAEEMSKPQLTNEERWKLLDCYTDLTWDSSACRAAGVSKRGDYFDGPLGSSNPTDPNFNPELRELLTDCRGRDDGYCASEDREGEEGSSGEEETLTISPSFDAGLTKGVNLRVCDYNYIDATGLSYWRMAIPEHRRAKAEMDARKSIRIEAGSSSDTVVLNGNEIRPYSTVTQPNGKVAQIMTIDAFLKGAGDNDGLNMLQLHRRVDAQGTLDDLHAYLGKVPNGAVRVVAIGENRIVFGDMIKGAKKLSNRYEVDCW